MVKPEFNIDICIAGAGPAGLAAALKLSREGIPFIFLEKETFPRGKICGDGFGGKGLITLKRIDPKLLEDFHAARLGNPSWGTKFFSPSLKSVTISFAKRELENPPGYVIRRRELDDYLLSRVKKMNTGKIFEGSEVISAKRAGAGILLETSGDGPVIHCQILLLATGTVPAAFRKVIPGLPPAVEQGLGIMAYFENISGFGEDNAIEIHFLKELLPCYLWIFPLGKGSANVGLAMPSDRVTRQKIILKDLLFELLERYPHLNVRFTGAMIQGKVEAHRLAFYHGKMPISADNILLLGDAARLVDPFTGEGIGNAMVSGVAAAETAIQAIHSKDFALKSLMRYDHALYDRIEKDLALGLRLRDLAVNRRLINLVVAKAAKSTKAREALRDVLFGLNAMKELSQPMFYAKLVLGLE